VTGPVVPTLLALASSPTVTVLTGAVTQASPLLVLADNASTSTACKRLASYTPTLGHRVVLLDIQGSDRLCLGQVV
jgi:hypothetical protein